MRSAFIPSLLAVVLSACSPSEEVGAPFPTDTPDAASPSSSFLTPLSAPIAMRSDASATFPEGARLCVVINGDASCPTSFVSNGTAWTNESGTTWDAYTDSVDLTVLYPGLPAYDASSLYSTSGALLDLSVGRQRIAVGEVLCPVLTHRLSRLRVEVDESLRASLTSLRLTVPCRLTAVDPSDASLTVEADTVVCTVAADGSPSYEFLLPPDREMALQLTVATASATFAPLLLPSTFFAAATPYATRLQPDLPTVGIHTPEEFLEFVTLYHTSLTQALQKFAVEEDGRYVFRILADLDFSDLDLTDYETLSHSTAFNYVLDGMGHTLRHLTFPDNRGGLIANLGEEGEICRLTLEDCRTDVSGSISEDFGLLTNTASGVIRHCHIVQSSLTDTSSKKRIGAFAGSFSGTLINSSARETTLTGGLNSGAVGLLKGGSIVNCAFSDFFFSCPKTCGTLCGKSLCLNKANCYIFNCEVYKTKYELNGKPVYGYFVGDAKNLYLAHCYYTGTQVKLFGTQDSTNHLETPVSYDAATFAVTADGASTPVVDLLNAWVGEQAQTYEGISLAGWSYSPTLARITLE